jgi:mannose-6-phosphate isomerase-like protein (cupin superfamily)
MNVVNAVSKVRFASARPQRVQLSRSGAFSVEMLCMEAGQKVVMDSGSRVYYVVMGTATLTAGGESASLATGHLAATDADEPHTLANGGEGRLVCLALRPA